jgi:hypothetical protein
MKTSASKSFADTLLSGACSAIIMQRTPKGVRFTKGGCLICGEKTSRRTMKPLTQHNGLNKASTLLTLAMAELGDNTRSPLCAKHWGSSFDMERRRQCYIGYRNIILPRITSNEWTEELTLLHWLTGAALDQNREDIQMRSMLLKTMSQEEYGHYIIEHRRREARVVQEVEDSMDWWYTNYYAVTADITFEELLIIQKSVRKDIMDYSDDTELRQAIRESDRFEFIRVSKPTTFQYPTRKQQEYFEALRTRDFAKAEALDKEIKKTNNKRGWNL